jgi:hypothetical protein
MPGLIGPCLPSLSPGAAEGSGRLHEIKPDGVRMLVHRARSLGRVFARGCTQ